MVMMLTAGLGVSEMMIGWDNAAAEVGGVTLLPSMDAADTPLGGNRNGSFLSLQTRSGENKTRDHW